MAPPLVKTTSWPTPGNTMTAGDLVDTPASTRTNTFETPLVPHDRESLAACHLPNRGNVIRALLKFDMTQGTGSADMQTRRFDAMCARLEEHASPGFNEHGRDTSVTALRKKVIATWLAKTFEQELSSNDTLKKLFDDLSVNMQTAVSLFVPPQDRQQAALQQDLLKRFFGEHLVFTDHGPHTGAVNPDNLARSGWFYQYKHYAYDRVGELGQRTGSSAEDKNFLDNSHPFYAMSLVMNLLYATHRVPVQGHDYDGTPTQVSRFEDMLTKPFLSGYLRYVNHGAREWTSGDEPQSTEHVFGPFAGRNEQDIAIAAGLAIREAPDEFTHPEGWANGKLNYDPRPDNLYTGKALEKDYFVAAASGTTAGILCAHVRLAELTHFLKNDGQALTTPIDRQAMRRELLDMTVGLFSWMGLAGDHSLYEVAFSHAFMNKYCDGFMDDYGKLCPATDAEVAIMIHSVQEEDFITDFLSRARLAHPDMMNRLVNKLAALEADEQSRTAVP